MTGRFWKPPVMLPNEYSQYILDWLACHDSSKANCRVRVELCCFSLPACSKRGKLDFQLRRPHQRFFLNTRETTGLHGDRRCSFRCSLLLF